MKKGYTLMEILAVLLVIAVLASFAVPVMRSIMVEVRYHRAKVAGVKMAEAIRAFYTDTKGYRVTGDITGPDVESLVTTSTSCQSPALSGIPPYDQSYYGEVSETSYQVEQLFHCNYLAIKDFSGLNYKFDPGYCASASDCLVAVVDMGTNKGCFWVDRSSKIIPKDSVADCGV